MEVNHISIKERWCVKPKDPPKGPRALEDVYFSPTFISQTSLLPNFLFKELES